ncbi:hypothetical protein [Herbaspirillum sp.]|uniref:hypothetical protein n=1 Tax=Herbaspirillum sp. TaxID=1890675 RepID=UPI001B1F2C76|nr:hypothetical protein [Herbaspirillum sp.]MBO9537017.1 hypothetical protein [Herbaspirillum sp.]
MKIVRRLAASLLVLACSAGVAPVAQAAPQPSFGIEIGNALLCLNQLNSKYFYDYLTEAFGPPYKTEGGAFWFKASNVNLWGVQVTDLLVNDSSSQADFIGAFFNATPVKLTESISSALGIRFTPDDNSAYPVRQSQAGSKIVYNNTNAKMYCAKSKFLVPSPQQPGP